MLLPLSIKNHMGFSFKKLKTYGIEQLKFDLVLFKENSFKKEKVQFKTCLNKICL